MKQLSRRERQILVRTAKGMLSREIAAELGITDQTVRHQRIALYRKVGAQNAAHAVALTHDIWKGDAP